MDIINLIPENYRPWLLFALAIAPYITRAWHALIQGGGLRGVWQAIWFGTNTPPPKPEKISRVSPQSSARIAALALAVFLPALFLVGCAGFKTKQTDSSFENGKLTRQIITEAKSHTLFDAKSELAKFKAVQTDKSQSASVGSINQESSGTNSVALLESLAKVVAALQR